MTKLKEILQHYVDTYEVESNTEEVYEELINNNVEVRGDSFYCEIKHDDLIVLLAGTKDSADIWVLKKIIKRIKSGKTIITLLNGNSEHILPMLKKYNVEVTNTVGSIVYLRFN